MKNILINGLTLLLIASIFTGCLDDDKYALDPGNAQNVLEFGNINVPSSPLGSVYPLYVVAFGVSPEDGFEITVNYSGPNDNNKNIDITLEVDPLAVEMYNQQFDANYVLLPDNLFDIASMTVTIPKGQRSVAIPVTVFPDQYDLALNYMLPLKIASSSSGIISTNYGTALFGTVVKNRYDGVYTISEETASFLDVTNAAFTGIYPKTVSLRTVNGNTVDYYDEIYDTKFHIFSNAGAATYYGGFVARIIFDNATGNVTDVQNGYGQGNNNRSGKLDPAQPTTPKMTFQGDGVTPISMELWYIMRQINTGVDRTFFHETFEYVGPRD